MEWDKKFNYSEKKMGIKNSTHYRWGPFLFFKNESTKHMPQKFYEKNLQEMLKYLMLRTTFMVKIMNHMSIMNAT